MTTRSKTSRNLSPCRRQRHAASSPNPCRPGSRPDAAPPDRSDNFLVMYIKLSNIKRQRGVEFRGPYIAGTAPTRRDADALVQQIIGAQRGYAVIPKVIPISTSFEQAHIDAVGEFQKDKEKIRDADKIIHRHR